MQGKREEKKPGEPGEGPVTKVNLGRLTNCIFVFTLLYLFKNIHIPSILDAEIVNFLPQYVANIVPEVFNFFNAFLIVAIIWVLTFHIIHRIRRVNHVFLYLHFGMLMTLVFIPVSSLLADDFPFEPFFSFVLHANIMLISTFLLLEWIYILRDGDLIHPYISYRDVKETYLRLFLLMAAAITGGILTQYDLEQTRFIYIFVLIILFVESVISDMNRERKTEKADHKPIADIRKDMPQPLKSSQFSPLRTLERKPYYGPVGIDMLEILMNGVFGFTMTLVVKNIPLPKVTDVQNYNLLVEFALRMAFDTLEFIFVFVILAFFWILAFQILRWMKAIDLTFVYLELFELLLIVFIPVTSILVTFFGDDPDIYIAFGLNILLCGFILITQWYYVSRRTDLLNDEALVMIRESPRRQFWNGRIQILSSRGSNRSFIAIRNRLLILPLAALFLLALSFEDFNYSFLPIFAGASYLVYRSWD